MNREELLEKLNEKVYLGDVVYAHQVYAHHDGYHVILETFDGASVTNTITLEPAILDSLGRFNERIAKLVRQYEET